MQNVAFTGTTKTITYTYDAAGQRLRKAYYNGSGTTTSNYANGFANANLGGMRQKESFKLPPPFLVPGGGLAPTKRSGADGVNAKPLARRAIT